MNQKLLSVAKGETPADLVIRNGKVVNVYSGEIYDGGVAICGDTIAAVGDVEYCIGEGTRVVDAEGKYLTPGFLDGHIHPESSSLAIRPFAEAVLAHGTTGIMTDLHEVGVVSGLEGIEAILKEAEATDLKIYFVVPSHVPFSPNLETSGGRFNPEIIRKALKRPDAVGLSECVGPYITAGFPDLLESFDTTLSMPGKTLQGHLPDMYGPAMSTCIAAGVSTDHESFCEKDVFERLRNGCHLMMREGSAARNMPVLLKTVMENHLDTAMVSIVTDDLHTVDLQERGHLDDSLRTALGMGLDFVKAIQMVTVNCARAFNLDREIGGLAPGRRADVNITTGPEDFRVLTTFAGGRQITDNGKLLVHYETAEHEPCVLNTMHLKNPITADSFKIHAPAGAKKVKALVMDTALHALHQSPGRGAAGCGRRGAVRCGAGCAVYCPGRAPRQERQCGQGLYGRLPHPGRRHGFLRGPRQSQHHCHGRQLRGHGTGGEPLRGAGRRTGDRPQRQGGRRGGISHLWPAERPAPG